jgi:hypothetical protein
MALFEIIKITDTILSHKIATCLCISGSCGSFGVAFSIGIIQSQMSGSPTDVLERFWKEEILNLTLSYFWIGLELRVSWESHEKNISQKIGLLGRYWNPGPTECRSRAFPLISYSAKATRPEYIYYLTNLISDWLTELTN